MAGCLCLLVGRRGAWWLLSCALFGIWFVWCFVDYLDWFVVCYWFKVLALLIAVFVGFVVLALWMFVLIYLHLFG